jgi:hypothetical protein
MKLDCGPTYAEQIAALKEWHDWFAWYPVRLCVIIEQTSRWPEFHDSRDCRWLETIERRGHLLPSAIYGMPEWHWEYRARGVRP